MTHHEKLKKLVDKLAALSKEGKSTFSVRKQIAICHLDAHKESPYEVEVKISPANDCPLGMELSILKMTVEEAYETMPIPAKKCKRYSGCVCRYLLYPLRNEAGDLIMKPQADQQATFLDQLPPPHKEYNLNTKYGRRKARDQAARYRESLSPKERSNYDTNGCIVLVIIVAIVLLILYSIGSEKAVMQWLRR